MRTEAAAEESLAAMRARMRFGIAIAAMMRMMATTISNSISEKPFCFRIEPSSPFQAPLRGRNKRRRKVLLACGGPSRGQGVPRLRSGQPPYFQPDAGPEQHLLRIES